MAQNPVDTAAVLRERKPQSEQDHVVAALDRAAHDAMERKTLLHHALVNTAPILCGLSAKDLVGALAGDLLPIDVVQARSRQPERRLVDAIPDIDQTDMGKQPRDLEGIEI